MLKLQYLVPWCEESPHWKRPWRRGKTEGKRRDLQLNGQESEQTPGDNGGQESLACHSPCDHKRWKWLSDRTISPFTYISTTYRSHNTFQALCKCKPCTHCASSVTPDPKTTGTPWTMQTCNSRDYLKIQTKTMWFNNKLIILGKAWEISENLDHKWNDFPNI